MGKDVCWAQFGELGSAAPGDLLTSHVSITCALQPQPGNASCPGELREIEKVESSQEAV